MHINPHACTDLSIIRERRVEQNVRAFQRLNFMTFERALLSVLISIIKLTKGQIEAGEITRLSMTFAVLGICHGHERGVRRAR